jgi:uncharacterized protein (DUF305 family)
MSRQRVWTLAAVAAVLLGVVAIVLVTRGGSDDAPAAAAPSPSSSPVRVIIPGKPGESAVVTDSDNVRAPDGSTYNTIDATFAQMMIVHHQQALQMAELAPGRGADKQLLSLATRIRAAQQPEIEYLRDWLRERGKPDSDPAYDHATMPGMQSAAAMAELTAAQGADFDKRFVTMMSDHHRGAQQMASDVLNGGSDQRLAEFAAEMAVEQTAEINRMAGLGVA